MSLRETAYMALKVRSYIFEKKSTIVLICLVGVSGVAYGMLKDNDLIFIVGVLFVIGGYVLIRRKIRAFIRNRP